MSADSKQFNRNVLSYEELERQLRHARELRSKTFARGVERISAALGSSSQRLFGGVRRALHHKGESGRDAPRLGWRPGLPAAGIGAGGAVRCK